MERGYKWDNRQWTEYLEEGHPRRSEALQALGDLILRALERSFRPSGRLNREALEDLCQESLIRILEQRGSFEGRSRFTSWAVKVAVNLTLTELRHKRWKDVSLDEQLLESPLFDASRMNRFYLSPETRSMRRATAEMMNRMIEERLSEKQKRALKMVVLYEIPLEEAASRLGTNRNALYKLLHDARKRLKEAFLETGMSRAEVLSGLLMVFSGTNLETPVVKGGEE